MLIGKKLPRHLYWTSLLIVSAGKIVLRFFISPHAVTIVKKDRISQCILLFWCLGASGALTVTNHTPRGTPQDLNNPKASKHYDATKCAECNSSNLSL